ncbi:MAG: hypothetical protein JKY26_01880 [Pseudomonas sp.]|nr:hypothetical protein [Pseudomonas sp.]
MHDKQIIHFTETYNSLSSILLDSSFKLSYCSEIFTVKGSRVSSAAHPMVCFSAYSTIDLNGRNITYGRYAIVMKKTWVNANTVTPVLYVDSYSQVALALGKMLRSRQGKETFKLPDELRLPVIQLKCFTKNSRGYNSYYKEDNFLFYEENEWRFVPTLSELDGARLSQNLSTYENNKLKHEIKLSGHSLNFKYQDIEKVYVEHEVEVSNVKSILGGSTVVEVSPWITKSV